MHSSVKEMTLVEPPPRPRVPYPLLEHQIYQQTGSNKAFVVSPSIVHFGGFSPGGTHTLTLRVTNKSIQPQRLHIVPPQSAFFEISYTKKARFVAPGMALAIQISFSPDDVRYYYDCIRLHCPGTNLLVPIHAYPVVSNITFPSVLDFGVIELGNHASRTLKLATDVPIGFDFAIVPVDGSALPSCFDIVPSQGVIPPEGEVSITVTFKPLAYVTARADIQLQVSQFNFTPMSCQLVGSSQPGLLRDALVQRMNQAAAERTAVLSEELERVTYGGAKLVTTGPVDSYDTSVKIIHAGGGAGHGDPFTQRLQRAASKKRATRRAVPAINPPAARADDATPAADAAVSDLETLRKLSSHGTVVSMLNRKSSDKASTPNLRTAIAEKHEAQSRARDYKSALDDLFHNPDESRQVKEYAFSELLAEEAAARRANELKLSVVQGAALPSHAELERILQLRESFAATRKHRSEARALAAHASWTSDARPALTKTGLPFALPRVDYDTRHGVDWAQRARALSRLRDAVRTIIIRARAAKRLAKIRAFLAVMGFDKDKVAAIVGDEKRQQETALEAYKQEAATLPLVASADRVLVDVLPLLHSEESSVLGGRDQGGVDLEPMPMTSMRNAIQFSPIPLKAHIYAEVNHYDAYPLAQISHWVPPEDTRVLREGAEEEDVVRSVSPELVASNVVEGPHGGDGGPVSGPPQEPLPLPAQLLQPPLLPPLHVFNPTPELSGFIAPLPYSEVEDAYLFKPRLLDAGSLAASRNHVQASLTHAKSFVKPSSLLVPRNAPPFHVPPPPPPAPGSGLQFVLEDAADPEDSLDPLFPIVSDLGLPLPSQALIKAEFPAINTAAASSERLSGVEDQLESKAQDNRLSRLRGMQGRLGQLSSLFQDRELQTLLRTYSVRRVSQTTRD